jgi:hypothetical protein
MHVHMFVWGGVKGFMREHGWNMALSHQPVSQLCEEIVSGPLGLNYSKEPLLAQGMRQPVETSVLQIPVHFLWNALECIQGNVVAWPKEQGLLKSAQPPNDRMT